MTCPECGEALIRNRVGRISPYPHYDVYLECPSKCNVAFFIGPEPPDEELMKKFRVSTKQREDEKCVK